jgi:hypothetical protein
MSDATPPRLASAWRGDYQTFMKRPVISIILVCLIASGSHAFGDVHKPVPRKKRGTVHSDARRFGRKIEHAFRSVGGHLQKFFTGRDTVSR